MKMTDRVRIPDEVISREVGDGTVMLDLAKGAYYGLDETGTRAWNLLGEGKTLEEVCDAITAEFDVARDAAERDLLALAEDLAAQNLIVPA